MTADREGGADPIADADAEVDRDAHRWWGRAEDGATVSVVLSAALASELTDVLPPFGLEAVPEPDAPVDLAIVVTGTTEADATVAVRVLDPGHEDRTEPATDEGVDGEARVGTWPRLESELGLFAAEHLRELVAVHAGMVVVEGRGLVLPGPSFAGKSTLCRALVDRGATVLSDEYAVVAPATGRVRAWPRPLRLRQEDGSVRRLRLEGVPAGEVEVHLVATMRYLPDQRVVLQEATRADAVMAILANTVPARRRPEAAFTAANAVMRHAEAINGWRGEAAAAADALVRRLESGMLTEK